MTDRRPAGSEADLAQNAWKRAVADAKRALGSHGVWKFEAVASMAGAAVGALAPSDAETATRIGYAVAAAAVTAVGVALLVFLWSLFRAPYRQRDEARAELQRRSSAILVVEPVKRVEKPDKLVKTAGGKPDVQSFAGVVVKNGNQDGVERATALGVGPEVTLLRDGREVSHWRGWSTSPLRDFTAAGEDDTLWVASKWRSQPDGHALAGKRDEVRSALPQGSFEVLVALRGTNIDRVEERFLLTNPGPSSDLKIEPKVQRG